jgi:type IV pilus assembly protein PilV
MGMIEVLVSVLVLAVGLLGIAAMQSLALRGGQSSLESSQAVMQTNAIIEAMRANRADAASYNGTYTAPPTAASLATRDVNIWMAGMQGGVADADGKTTTPGIIGAGAKATIAGCPNDCVITIEWNDTRAGGGAARQVITGTRI